MSKVEKNIPRHPGLYWRGKRIWMRYYNANHQWVRESTGKDSIADAVAILEERKTLARQGKFPILQKGKKIKFETFKDEYLSWKKIDKPRSYAFINHIIKQLNIHFAKYNLDQITAPVVRAYMMQQCAGEAKFRGKTVSPATVNRKISILRNALNFAVKEKYLIKNPVDDWKEFFGEESERTRLFSKQEIDSLLALSAPPLRWFIIIAINTGCRLREITELPWHEVDLNRRVINLNAKRTKGKRTRTIAMTDVVYNLLSERKLQRDAIRQKREKNGQPSDQGTEYVFPNPETGKPYSGVSHAWGQLLKKCNIKPLPGEPSPRFHDLRHTAATNMAMNGAPQAVIRDILGHKYSRTTDRYMASTDAARKAALESIQHGVPAGEIVELTKVAK